MPEKIDDLDFSSIKSIKDEHSYWSGLSIRFDLKGEVGDRANLFAEQLKKLSEKFVHVNDNTFQEMLEVVEIAQDSFDNIWKLTQFEVYPEPRMDHLFRIFGQSLQDYIIAQFAGMNIWTEPYGDIKENLRKAVLISF
jgi:dynein heavy chain 2